MSNETTHDCAKTISWSSGHCMVCGEPATVTPAAFQELIDIVEGLVDHVDKGDSLRLRNTNLLNQAAELIHRLSGTTKRAAEIIVAQREEVNDLRNCNERLTNVVADLANLVDDIAHQIDYSPRTAMDVAMRAAALKTTEENGRTT